MQFLVPDDLDLLPLTLTFKLVRARDQTRLPCEFGAYPFCGSGDISCTKSHRQRQKQNLTRSSLRAATKWKAKAMATVFQPWRGEALRNVYSCHLFLVIIYGHFEVRTQLMISHWQHQSASNKRSTLGLHQFDTVDHEVNVSEKY